MLCDKDQVIVNGGSMRPFLRTGQRLVFTRACRKKLRPGDLVVFKSRFQEKLIIHRIRCLQRKGDDLKLLTRGDNVGKSDGWTDISQIMGVAVATVKDGRVQEIRSIALRAGLVLAPLIFRLRELLIPVLAFFMPFLYPYLNVKTVSYIDAAGRSCVRCICLGRLVCRNRPGGKGWVHPVFAKTPILKDAIAD